MKEENYFVGLSSVDCSNHVEKKGRFNYLSWTYAVQELKKLHPTATWEVCRFDGMPFMSTQFGVFVEVAVTVEGITHSQIHPVLNNQNKPIDSPNSFQINTSIQRCLVKAIALHGLGLYIYSGEDLPESAKEEAAKPDPMITDVQLGKLLDACDKAGISAEELCKTVRIKHLDYLQASRFDGAMKYLLMKEGIE